MISVKIDDLKRSDIGRKFTVGEYTGVLSSFCVFKGHAEVIFEDGKRFEIGADSYLEYDNSVELKLTVEEVQALIENHPAKEKYLEELESYNRARKYHTGNYAYKQKPSMPRRMVVLAEAVERVKR